MAPACAERSSHIVAAALSIPSSVLASLDATTSHTDESTGGCQGIGGKESSHGRRLSGMHVAAAKVYAEAWNARVDKVLKDAVTMTAMEHLLQGSPDVASLLNWVLQAVMEVSKGCGCRVELS